MLPTARIPPTPTTARLCALTLLATLWCACGEGTQTPPPPPGLTVSPATSELEPGSTTHFTARLGQELADVSWSTSAGTIDVTGLFTAPAHGTSATVTAVLKADTSVSASASVVSKDTRPPAVLSSSPAGGAADVPVMSPVRIEFNEELDPASVSPGTVQILPMEQADSASSSIQLAYEQRVLTVTPGIPMRRDADVTVQLSGLRDGAGNAVPQLTLRFKTRAGTLVSQDLSGAARFTQDGSPYVFDPNKVVHLTRGSSLQVEPGVVVFGSLTDDGETSIQAIGTAEEPVTFWNGLLRGTSSSNHVFKYTRFLLFNPGFFTSAPTGATVTYEHCLIDWMRSSLAVYSSLFVGAGSMSDCELESGVTLYGDGGTFRRNTLHGLQLILGPNHFNPLVVENNLLRAGKLYVAPQGTRAVIRGNSFIGLTNRVQQLTIGGGNAGRTGGTFDLSGNYWGTTVEAEIDALVLDSADDSAANYTIQWKPFLSEPAPETPAAPLVPRQAKKRPDSQ
ncbi:Ig-like domain-containing protein [Archangium violaceum]|nr:Ig-like domain-containing protein [Archangium violaceum]